MSDGADLFAFAFIICARMREGQTDKLFDNGIDQSRKKQKKKEPMVWICPSGWDKSKP